MKDIFIFAANWRSVVGCQLFRNWEGDFYGMVLFYDMVASNYGFSSEGKMQ